MNISVAHEPSRSASCARRCLAVCLLIVATACNLALADERPNFLLMVADDMTWSDLGYEGHPNVRTPHLDKLCRQSMHLTRMFSPATTCSPSRHALYTGLYSVRSGAYPNHTRLYDGTKSIFGVLKEVGYRVALQNKSHVGPRSSFPYEVIKGADDLTATEDFLRRDSDEPWLLVYASNDPHTPWSRGPRELYDPETLTVPDYLHDNADTRQRLCEYYAEITKFDRQVGDLLDLLDRTGQSTDTLVMFVSEQGSSFPYGGKWSVYDTGIRASTLVRWPGQVEAGSTSDALLQYVDVVPTLLEAAGVDPDAVDTGCPDANGDRGFDGSSFLGVLQATDKSFRDHVFAQHTTVGIIGYQEPYPMRAVRDDHYKLILNLAPDNTYGIRGIHENELLKSWQDDAENDAALAARVEWLFRRPAEELYDLRDDPHEMTNLADQAEYHGIKSRLRAELDAWMKQQGDEGLATELRAHARQPRARKAKSGSRPRPARQPAPQGVEE